MDQLLPGQMLGSYRIISQIGEGGMATVYKAYQASMDRNVAIKVLPSHLAKNKEFAGRFQQEARIIANLEHPHILPVFDSGESDGISYLVMRYLEAGTLKEKIESRPLSLNEIDRIFTQLAEALSYAHDRGVIHRDLKPSNALIDSQGNLFLTDFGIAKLLENTSHFTKTDTVMGTPAYISPEQAQGQPVDRRSDIYSLGIILYEMVTGRVPFMADTPLAVIYKHVNAPLPPPSTIKKDIPPQIEQVILKALAKSQDDRFGNATEFVAAWKRALSAGETVQNISTNVDKTLRYADYNKNEKSTPPTVAMQSKDTSRKPARGVWIGLLAGICLIVGIGGLAIFAFNQGVFPSPSENNSADSFEIEIGDEISNGEPEEGAGNIESPGAQDIYTFTAEPGEMIFLRIVQVPETNNNVSLFLTDSEDTNIISSCLECGDPGMVALILGGTYTLTVGSDNPENAGVGEYRLQIWEVPPPEEFGIEFGEKITRDQPDVGAGFIESPGARDVYIFEAEAGDDIYFQMNEAILTSGPINWSLSDEAGTILFETCLQCGDPGVITMDRGGTYMLTVGGGTEYGTGAYSIVIWSVPAYQIFEIEIGDTVSGAIESPGAHNLYTFTATAGQTVAFAIQSAPQTRYSIQWRLEDADENEFFNTCLSCDEPDPITFEEDGTYTLIIGSDTSPGTGEYEFQIYSP